MSSNRYRLSKMKALSLQNLNEIDSTEWKSNYHIKTKEIGRGHFSKVYHIVCKQTSKAFAAKVIRRRRSGRDLIDKIRREADLIKKLNEGNVDAVIRMHKSFENFSEIILILELANGGSVYNLVENSREGLDQNYTREVIKKVLEALSKCHDDNIVHLDIKADNILLREIYPSTNVAICDFGLAIQLKDGVKHKEIVGTPDYMAPETISYEEISVYADMWSMGVLVYFMLTKVSPFIGSSKDSTLHNVSRAVVPFISKFSQPDYQLAQSLISSLCIKNPKSRLSASEALSHDWFSLNSTAILPGSYKHQDTASELQPLSIQISVPEDTPEKEESESDNNAQDRGQHITDQQTTFEWDQEKITLKNRCPSLIKIPGSTSSMNSLVISSASWRTPRFSITPKLDNVDENYVSPQSSLSIDETNEENGFHNDGEINNGCYNNTKIDENPDEPEICNNYLGNELSNNSYHGNSEQLDNGNISDHDQVQVPYCNETGTISDHDQVQVPYCNETGTISDHDQVQVPYCNETGDKGPSTQLEENLIKQCSSSGDIASRDYVNIQMEDQFSSLSSSIINIDHNNNHNHRTTTQTSNTKFSSSTESDDDSYLTLIKEICMIL